MHRTSEKIGHEPTDESKDRSDFIRTIIEEDNKTGKFGGRVITRFPPEPNGYLHIGHAKSISLNFGIAAENDGECHLRFDDTNPAKEGVEYVQAIQDDIRWLGYDWGEHLYFASDHFSKLYDFAVELIKANKAYVCDLNPEEIRQYRGTLTEPGRNSPYRDRPYEENLNLLERMRAGEFDEGARVLRAKINMASGNLNMRDPVLYRIMKTSHHRTQDNWCIYPTYDFAHGQSDSIEGVTHSICTTEFEDHRPLYDWILDQLGIFHPQQIEFARLNISNTMMSKRKLADLVEDGEVTGWNDPRMPTLTAMRRRGYTPEAVRTFCTRVGVAKRQNVVEMALLEHLVREDLNIKSRRVMAVLRPIRVVIENYPKDQVEELDAINNPEDPSMGSRKLPFSRELYIEEDDFQEDPPKKYFRLAPGREVRLRYGYFITCVGVIKNQIGDIVELRCTYDPQSRGGQAPDGRKVKGTIHWVSAKHAQRVEVRLYEYLFKSVESDGKIELISNPNSLETLRDCMAEPSLIDATPGHRFQFERLGYFCVDTEDSSPTSIVFNRTVTLRDTWSKIQHR
ncbi:glutamine--tRNA ligase/YqeY domain fusion protein [Dehalococcoidia bacterium]|nr:glutamine--tRNA ligase/YqeY domain fusion protein [Dehalococcoidia bacterium]